MNITVTELPQSKVKVCVTLPPERFDRCYALALRNAGKKLTLPGFRAGKAPEDMVEKEVGVATLLQEASEIAVQQSLPDAIKEHGLDILGQPNVSIQKMAKGNEFSYEAELAIFPKVALSNLDGVSGTLEVEPVTDEQIQEQLAQLQKSRSTTSKVDRAAKNGDVALVDFIVRMDGAKIEGGESKNHPLVLGEGAFIPGFEEKVVGASAGEKLEFSLSFPKDYHASHLAGKDADFEVTVQEVQERVLPEIDDAFASSLGAFKDLDGLKKAMRENLEREGEAKAHDVLRDSILEQLQKDLSLDLPDVLVSSEQDRLLQDFERRVQSTGADFDDYLRNMKKTREEVLADFKPVATKRITTYLVLREVAHTKNITVSDDELGVEFSKLLAQYPDPEVARKQFNEKDMKAVLKDQILQEKVLTTLEDIAQKNASGSSSSSSASVTQ